MSSILLLGCWNEIHLQATQPCVSLHSKEHHGMIKWNICTLHCINVYDLYNRSQDDPLLLYAALYSGMGTKFLSRDLMRGHAYRLQNQSLRSTFRQWQLQNQCQLKYVTEAGKVHIKVIGRDFTYRSKIDYILSIIFDMYILTVFVWLLNCIFIGFCLI